VGQRVTLLQVPNGRTLAPSSDLLLVTAGPLFNQNVAVPACLVAPFWVFSAAQTWVSFYNMTLQFGENTGANTLVGDKNLVDDNGEYHCDDDEEIDPNIITGSGTVLHGVKLGEIVSEGASSHNEMH